MRLADIQRVDKQLDGFERNCLISGQLAIELNSAHAPAIAHSRGGVFSGGEIVIEYACYSSVSTQLLMPNRSRIATAHSAELA